VARLRWEKCFLGKVRDNAGNTLVRRGSKLSEMRKTPDLPRGILERTRRDLRTSLCEGKKTGKGLSESEKEKNRTGGVDREAVRPPVFSSALRG